MYPTDPSDSHLQDRAVEFRALKSLVVVFLLTLAAVFYPWQPVVAVFGVGYLAYMFRYYTRRVGVYTGEDLSVRHDRLEYGLLGFAAATVGTLLAIETAFSEEWTLGGFLSLPAVEFTDVNAFIEEPTLLLAWVVVLIPVVAASYVGLQFRKRLLVGVNTDAAAVRATLWDGLARLPVVLLWIAVLNAGPIYDIWQPVVEQTAAQLDLSPDLAPAFGVVLGDAFEPVLVGSIGTTAVVVGSYLAVQRWKYPDATVPEVLGYRGLLSPSRRSHQLNVVVPVAVYLLYAIGIAATIGTEPLGERRLLAAVVLSVLVGANVLARTTTGVEAASEWVARHVDAVVVGLGVGAAGLVALGPVVPADAGVPTLLLSYPVVGIPAAYAGNRLGGQYEIRNISAYVDRIEADWDAFDEATTDRLFVHSDARDNSLRAAAVDGLASSVQASAYRQDDALDVFSDALRSDDRAVVRSGVRGLATALSYSQPPGTYDRLVEAGTPERVVGYLDSEDGRTRILAAESAARIYTLELSTSRTVPSDRLAEQHVDELAGTAEDNPQDRMVRDAVVEYFATLWYTGVQVESRDPREPALQNVLGHLLRLSGGGSQGDGLTAALAVTGERADADGTRVAVALDHLDSGNAGTRYLAAHVVRSSLDRHTDRIETDRLAALLEDESPAVRWMGAEAIATLLRFGPDRGDALRDRLVLHLEENQDAPGRPEAAVLRALSTMDADRLISHPTASSTVAAYVGDAGPLVAQPAAELLSSLVAGSRSIARRESVRAAIRRGLTHDSSDVRLACLEAVVAIVEDADGAAEEFVEGLAANLDAEGRRGVLAAVTLAEVVDASPEAGVEILPALAAGLQNRTPVDARSVPFMVRGGTVSAVTVDIVADAVALDPGRGEPLIDPLVALATTAEQSTLVGIFRVLSALSEEFPDASTEAVESAAVAVEEGRVSIRRDAAQVLANVAAYHPDAVVPFVDRLVVATDDDSPRVRSSALVALRNVCAAVPAAIEDDIHRIIGRLDDDSSVVRKHAARLIATVADREPEIVEPAAETSDRLRRLQRDPAVDVDPERLQDASTAIQTGVAATDVESAPTEREEIWTPESADEMGVSGDTNVFEPVGDDFDPSFDEEFDEEELADADHPAEDTTDSGADASPSTADIEKQGTVIEDNGPTDDDLGDRSTVIEDDGSPDDDLGDRSTVIEDDGSPDDEEGQNDGINIEDHSTVIERDGDLEDDERTGGDS